jgi:hypothetical protein
MQRTQSQMKSDQRARETKKTLRAFATVTALPTHANTARFHYGHCAFNTRAERNKMAMQKSKRATK